MQIPSKPIMQEVRSLVHDNKKKSIPTGKAAAHSSTGTGPAFQHYQAALQLLQQGKFDKALAAFEKLLSAAPDELLERCKMYITTCQQQMDKHNLTFLTPEEHYDYAVSQLNTGYYEEAREQFDAIVAAHPEADYALYGLALLDAMTGRVQDCLWNLSRAIELNPRNRLQARTDSDFQSMADDPRFTELLYPEVP
jgi:outer membrane protein assembly factor BamD (BamD/ComL family)